MALRADIEATFGIDVWRSLSVDLTAPIIEVPALIVHDEDDRDTELSDSARLADAWPGARLVTTRGLGHNRVVRDDSVVAEIVDFIAKQFLRAAEQHPNSV